MEIDKHLPTYVTEIWSLVQECKKEMEAEKKN